MILVDWLRPPTVLDPSASAYKDWFHLCVFDHASGAIGLVNTSLMGPSCDPRSRAGGIALVHTPWQGWSGGIEIVDRSQAAVGVVSIALPRVAMAVDTLSGRVAASAQLAGDGLIARVGARAATTPVNIREHTALGRGWISWFAVPRLSVEGGLTVSGRTLELSDADAYWDHNWGRWDWGDDFGWEWGAFIAKGSSLTVVASRITDRAHRRATTPTIVVQAGRARRTFSGPGAGIAFGHQALEATPRRLPGAMAALHQDRGRPLLGRTLRIDADDGLDCVHLEFTGRAIAQLIMADPMVRGYGYIHEIVGEFAVSGRLGGFDIAATGLGIVEHVD